MSGRVDGRRSNRRLSAVLIALSGVLGLLAICLVVFGNSQKPLQLGVIVGLWAALVAAFALPGLRKQNDLQQVGGFDLDAVQKELSGLHEVQLTATEETLAAHGQELRRIGELQYARESAARREADLNQQLAIRHEIERTVADQFGLIREEVSSLRTEVFEKLGGQIQLERIETTRIIGSDLEALQHEIRRLAEDRDADRAAREDRTNASTSFEPPLVQRAASSPFLPASPATPADTGVIDAEIVDASPVQRPSHVDSAPLIQSAAAGELPTSPQPATSPAAVSSSGGRPSDDDWGPVRAVQAKAAQLTQHPATPSSTDPIRPDPIRPDPVLPDPLPPAPLPPAPLPPAPRPAPTPARPIPDPIPDPIPPVPPPSPGPLQPPVEFASRDPFADLPRLTPVPADLLTPISQPRPVQPRTDPTSDVVPLSELSWTTDSEPLGEPALDGSPTGRSGEGESGSSGRRRAPEHDPESPRYIGRRRSAAELAEQAAAEELRRRAGRRRAPGHTDS